MSTNKKNKKRGAPSFKDGYTDLRVNNGSKTKYEEAKKNVTFFITPKAISWIKARGGGDFLERLARGLTSTHE